MRRAARGRPQSAATTAASCSIRNRRTGSARARSISALARPTTTRSAPVCSRKAWRSRSFLLLQGGAALGERQEIDAGCVKTCQQRFGLWHVAQSPAENQLDGVFGGGVNERLDLSGSLDHDCPAHVFGIEPECGALICRELRVCSVNVQTNQAFLRHIVRISATLVLASLGLMRFDA